MKKLTYILSIGALVLASYSCNNDDDSPAPDTNPQDTTTIDTVPQQNDPKPENVTFHFETAAMSGMGHSMGDFELNKAYATPAGDSVRLSSVRLWVSNLVLTDSLGNKWSPEPDQNYWLIEKTATSQMMDEMFTLDSVPAGKYTSLTFAVGVDSARNFSTDSVAGELAVDIGMAWNWATGYIFYKVDGEYFNGLTQTYDEHYFHIGISENYKEITLDLSGTPLVVDGQTDSKVHIMNNVLNLYTNYDLNTSDPTVKIAPEAQTLAGNIPSLFSVHHVE